MRNSVITSKPSVTVYCIEVSKEQWPRINRDAIGRVLLIFLFVRSYVVITLPGYESKDFHFFV
jgi:hypothetical protein